MGPTHTHTQTNTCHERTTTRNKNLLEGGRNPTPPMEEATEVFWATYVLSLKAFSRGDTHPTSTPWSKCY